jgi:hypothetical protein
MRIPTSGQWIALAVGFLGVGACGSAPRSASPPATASKSITVETLSIGTGVPQAARDVLNQAQGLFEQAKAKGTVVSIKQSRIGLEGETRLCADFSDPEAAHKALMALENLAKGVKLVNIRNEPCPPP